MIPREGVQTGRCSIKNILWFLLGSAALVNPDCHHIEHDSLKNRKLILQEGQIRKMYHNLYNLWAKWVGECASNVWRCIALTEPATTYSALLENT